MVKLIAAVCDDLLTLTIRVSDGDRRRRGTRVSRTMDGERISLGPLVPAVGRYILDVNSGKGTILRTSGNAAGIAERLAGTRLYELSRILNSAGLDGSTGGVHVTKVIGAVILARRTSRGCRRILRRRRNRDRAVREGWSA